MRYVPLMLVLLCSFGICSAGEERPDPSTFTVEQIAKMLPKRPGGFGEPIDNRPAWKALADTDAYGSVVRKAEALLSKPLPETSDELFLDFSRTGNRTRWQRVAGKRRGRITFLTQAECLENKGRFLLALEDAIAAICDERTWVMPAHDRGLANFNRKRVDIDLGSAYVAWNLALAHHLLGDRLSVETRKLIRENLRRRIFDPYLKMVGGERKKNWWMRTTNNWNAVCLSGVTGSALTMIEDREERAQFVAAAVKYSANFLKGFTSDGYCSEGVGYWCYGFGHYVLLAEAIHQATDGGVDLMMREGVRRPALFGRRIQIINGVCPAFADCGVTSRPSPWIMHFVSRRYGLGARPAADKELISPGGALHCSMMCSFPNSATEAPAGREEVEKPGARTWFDKAGVLICRPGDSSECRIGAAFKGGHNAEHHNHNDVGSYVIVVGDRPVLVDPGAEVYTARTFSSKRYESNVLNSFGHPVPRVAGRLQRGGRKARGRVLSTDFTEAADRLVLDIAGAYDAPGLEKLERTFIYSREGKGAVTIIDEVGFAEPATFESALITLGEWRKLSRDELLVSYGGRAVKVEISVSGAGCRIDAQQIEEDVKTKSLPTRLGITLTKPVKKARITLKVTPVED